MLDHLSLCCLSMQLVPKSCVLPHEFFFHFDFMINVMFVIFKSFYHFHSICFIILYCYVEVWLFYKKKMLFLSLTLLALVIFYPAYTV